MPVAAPLRRDFDASTLRRLARKCRDNRQIRKLPALTAVYDGMNRRGSGRVGSGRASDGVARVIKRRFGISYSNSVVTCGAGMRQNLTVLAANRIS